VTVPIERKNAVIYTEKFLLNLVNPKVTPRVPKSVREEARRLLRHYPSQFDMDTIAAREDGRSEVVRHKVFGNDYK
jgi:hypothetical protein